MDERIESIKFELIEIRKTLEKIEEDINTIARILDTNLQAIRRIMPRD